MAELLNRREGRSCIEGKNGETREEKWDEDEEWKYLKLELNFQ